MTYTFTYSNERVENGCEKESSVIVTDDAAKEVCRFSVMGYADEAGRLVMCKARLAEYLSLAGKAVATHPVMRKTDVVQESQLPGKVMEP